MKPSAKVIEEVKNGRGFILVGKQGKAWRAYQRPAHLCFAGDTTYELISPNGQEWTMTIGKMDPRPLVYRV